jgi:hypothetical protein
MTFRLLIMEKMGTLRETIHIILGCVVHLYGHWNKMIPLTKSSIFTNRNNGIKFHNCTYWSTKDIRNHHLSCRVTNHHNNNENPIFSSHVEIDS